MFCRIYQDIVGTKLRQGQFTSHRDRAAARQLNELTENIAIQSGHGFRRFPQIPQAPGRSCEIWACDYSGNLRFVRVVGMGLVEIRQDGTLLDPAAVSKTDGEEETGSDGEEVLS